MPKLKRKIKFIVALTNMIMSIMIGGILREKYTTGKSTLTNCCSHIHLLPPCFNSVELAQEIEGCPLTEKVDGSIHGSF